MFSDFDNSAKKKEGRGRFGVSAGISLVVFAALGALIAAAVATARAVVREQQADVEFVQRAPEPEPEVEVEPPPPPPPPPPRRRRARSAPRPAASSDPMQAPDSIPDEQPDEAEGELIEAGDTGPVEGFLDGGDPEPPRPVRPAPPPPPPPAPAPPAPPPEQERETVSRPRFLSGCQAPALPDAAIQTAETIRLVVRMLITPEGRCTDAEVVMGHPAIPNEVILECLANQMYEPARLPDGTAVPYPYRRRFTYRPSNL